MILNRVADLHKLVDQPLHDPCAVGPTPPEWLPNQVQHAAIKARGSAEAEDERQWLERVITSIAMNELSQLAESDQ